MASTEPTAAGTLRPFARSCDTFHIIGGRDDSSLILLDADADTQSLTGLALARLTLLERWLNLLSTSSNGLTYDPAEIATMLLPMAEDAVRIVDALNERLVAERRAQLAVATAST